MDIRFAILGLLSWKPLSGYDLKRIIAQSEVFYWSGNNNQIYNSLLALEKEGLVTHQVQHQESLPSKKIYTVTEAGLEELRQSLRTEPELPEIHKGFLIQLAWTETLTDEEILGLLEKYEAEVAIQLRMRLAERKEERPNRSAREQYLWAQIMENLIAGYQTELDWVQQTISGLREKKYLGGEEV